MGGWSLIYGHVHQESGLGYQWVGFMPAGVFYMPLPLHFANIEEGVRTWTPAKGKGDGKLLHRFVR